MGNALRRGIVLAAVVVLAAAAPTAADAAAKVTPRLKLRAVERTPGKIKIRVKSPWPNAVTIERRVDGEWQAVVRRRPGRDRRFRATLVATTANDTVHLRGRVRARKLVSRVVKVVMSNAAPPHADPDPAPAQPPIPREMPVGFNNNAVRDGLPPATAADLLSAVGATIDRVQINWGRFERTPGNYDFAFSDGIYAADLARGIRPLFILAYAPRWASGSTCAGVSGTCLAGPAPDYHDDFARAAAALAERYPGAAGIEVWNEPNLAHFWRPAADPDAYASVLRQAYVAIREVDPEMSVAGGSVVVTDPPATGSIGATDFLREVFEAGAAGAMDAISMHAYARGDPSGNPAVSAVQMVRDARDSWGDPSKPLWVTETGWSSTAAAGLGEVGQAAALAVLDGRLRAEPDVEMLLVHTLIDPSLGLINPESGFGIVRSDLSRKPAFCVLALAWAGSAAC